LSLETSFTYLSVIYAIRMFGLSFTLMPVMTSALNQLPPQWYAHGSAMANTLQQISASIGTAILVTLVAMGTTSFVPTASVSPEIIERQAQVTGFEWAFMGSTIMAFIALILAMFLHSPKKEREIVKEIHGENYGKEH